MWNLGLIRGKELESGKSRVKKCLIRDSAYVYGVIKKLEITVALKSCTSLLGSITSGTSRDYQGITIRQDEAISRKGELTSSRVERRLHPFRDSGLKKKDSVRDLHSSIDYSSCSAKDRSKFESGPAIQSILFPPPTEWSSSVFHLSPFI